MLAPISLEQIRDRPGHSPIEIQYENHQVAPVISSSSREFLFRRVEEGWAPVLSETPEPPAFEEVVISIDDCIVSSSGEVFTARREVYDSIEFGLRNLSGKLPPRFPLPRLQGVWIYGLHRYQSFGHWIANRIPKVLSASSILRFDGVLLNEMPWKTDGIVHALGINPSRIKWLRPNARGTKAQYFRVERLLIATEAVRKQPRKAVDLNRFDQVAQQLAKNLELVPNPSTLSGKRLYFSRTASPAARRPGCSNRSLLEELARENNFEVVYPEELSFRKQLQLILGVSTLVCESGSAGTLSMLSRATIEIGYLLPVPRRTDGVLDAGQRFPYARSAVLKKGGTFALGFVGEGQYRAWEAVKAPAKFALDTLPFQQ